MAFAAPWLSEEQVEFLGESTLVTIVPKLHMELLDLLTGSFGPFRPNVPVEVPLWLAVQLKKAKKCRLQPPSWLDLADLTSRLEGEKDDSEQVTALPRHYIEVATVILEVAADDVPNVTKLRATLSALESVRDEKVRAFTAQLKSDMPPPKLKNISVMEINKIKRYAVRAMDRFYEVSQERAATRKQGQRGSQSQQIASQPREAQQPIRRLRQLRDDRQD